MTATAEAKQRALAEALDGGNTPAARASAFARAATASIELKEFYGAAKQAEAGLRLAIAAGDMTIIATLQYLLGNISVWLGDMAQAEDNLQAFLAIAEDIVTDSDPRRGKAFYNLGLVMGQFRRYADARDHFIAAIPLLLAAGLPVNAAQAHLDVARAEMYLDNIAAARCQMERAQQLLTAHPDPQLETHLLCYRAQLQHLTHDFAGSDSNCQAVFRPDRPGVTDQHRGEAAWIMGENALATGRISEAQLFADLATQYATQLMYPWLINQAIDLRNRAAKLPTQAG